jgi:C1A family cysteine protease
LYETHEYDHAVLVIGYGKAVRGGDYFVIKNSFGEKWGSKGYAKISVSQMDNH